MSSARIPPTPRSPSIRSQPWPRSWNGKSANCIEAGVGSGWKRWSPSWSRSASGASRETSPSSSPASSVSSPLTARTSSTIPAPVRRRSRKRSAFSTSDRRSACQRPATRTNGSFAAARSASSCSLRTTSPRASCQSNVASEAVERRPLERAREAAARRGQVDPELARRPQPGARQQHRDAARFEQRHRLAQEELHLVAVELRLGGRRLRRSGCRARRAAARSRSAAGRGRGAGRSREGT